MPKVQVTLEFDSMDDATAYFTEVYGERDNTKPAPKPPTAASVGPVLTETQTTEPEPQERGYTDQDCRQAVLDYSNALGAEAMKERARAFGVKSTKELKPEQYAAFIKHMEVPKS